MRLLTTLAVLRHNLVCLLAGGRKEAQSNFEVVEGHSNGATGIARRNRQLSSQLECVKRSGPSKEHGVEYEFN